ncbi:hypothetical protein KP509_1Z224400 [Ceratopteris richardii]|nr:hypothetical protein KP509_1Z224400 [Ceratopteris richardii]
MQNKPERMVPDRKTGKGGACAEDGGWGETCSSYVDPKLRGWATSRRGCVGRV